MGAGLFNLSASFKAIGEPAPTGWVTMMLSFANSDSSGLPRGVGAGLFNLSASFKAIGEPAPTGWVTMMPSGEFYPFYGVFANSNSSSDSSRILK